MDICKKEREMRGGFRIWVNLARGRMTLQGMSRACKWYTSVHKVKLKPVRVRVSVVRIERSGEVHTKWRKSSKKGDEPVTLLDPMIDGPGVRIASGLRVRHRKQLVRITVCSRSRSVRSVTFGSSVCITQGHTSDYFKESVPVSP